MKARIHDPSFPSPVKRDTAVWYRKVNTKRAEMTENKDCRYSKAVTVAPA